MLIDTAGVPYYDEFNGDEYNIYIHVHGLASARIKINKHYDFSSTSHIVLLP